MRFILQNELTSRCAKNPNYSLRSFAKFLGVSPSALSAILNGKRPITEKMKERLGLKLGFSFDDLTNIKAKPHGNSKFKPQQENNQSFQQISIDIFKIISEPHHYALMELIKTYDFKYESCWMAKRLGVTPSEVNFAIERLIRAGLLEQNEDGGLQDTTNGFSTDIREGLSTQAQRNFQIQSLKKAISTIETVPLERRDNTSITMAINLNDLPKARQMIKDFRRSFCQNMEDASSLEEVYQLTIAFVPMTQNTETKRRKK